RAGVGPGVPATPGPPAAVTAEPNGPVRQGVLTGSALGKGEPPQGRGGPDGDKVQRPRGRQSRTAPGRRGRSAARSGRLRAALLAVLRASAGTAAPAARRRGSWRHAGPGRPCGAPRG